MKAERRVEISGMNAIDAGEGDDRYGKKVPDDLEFQAHVYKIQILSVSSEYSPLKGV